MGAVPVCRRLEPNSSLTNALGGAARSSGLTFVGSLTSAVAGFALSLILARTLGTSGSGTVFQVISVFTIASAVAKLGLDTTAVWLLPRLAADGPDDVRRATRILLLGSLLGGIATGVVLFAIAPLLDGDAQDLATITRIAAVFMPFSSVATVGLAITRGLGGVRDYVLIGSVGLPVGRLVAVSVAAAFAATAIVASAAWLMVLVVAAVLALIAVQRTMRRFRANGAGHTPDRELIRRIGAFSAPRTLSSTIEQSLQWLDVLVVGLLAGPAAAGVYGVVSRLVQAGTIPSTSMRIVVAPEFSRMLHQDRHAELNELYTRTAQWIVLFSMPIYVLLAVLAAPVLTIFGPGFEVGATALAVMCVGAAVSASTGNVQSLLLMSGRSGWAALNKVIVLAVSILLLLTLVPLFGIVGAAFASAVSVSLDAILAALQVRHGVKVRSSFRAVLLAVIASGLAAAVPAICARLLFGDTILTLVLGGVAAVAAWGAVLWFMRKAFALDEVYTLFARKRGKQ